MAGFGKYDSEFSALKALAYAMGCTTPIGGWDSSYSIMSTMYEHLTGSAPTEGVSLMSMVDEIQTGVESGEITVSYDCVNEIERLNEVVRGMENAVNNAESIKQQALNELRAEKDAIINDLQTQLNEGGVLDPALTSIGYTRDVVPDYYNRILNGCEYAKKIQDEWDTYNMDGMDAKFSEDNKLVFFPAVDTSRITGAGMLFHKCKNLEIVPDLDLSSCINSSSMFYECTSLKRVGDLTFHSLSPNETPFIYAESMFDGSGIIESPTMNDTNSIMRIQSMFQNCKNLKKVKPFDISGIGLDGNVDGMAYLFSGCTSLEEVGDFVLPPTAKSLTAVFQSCESLKKFPNWNTGNVKYFDFCFQSMGATDMWNDSKEKIDTTSFKWDTSSGKYFSHMFAYSALVNGPVMNTVNAQRVDGMFDGCSILQSLPEYDFSSVETEPSIFGWSQLEHLTTLGGFKNLKTGWSYGLVDMCPNLTADSLMNVINKLGDVTDNPQTATFGSNIEKLTPEQIQIATNKGWTISQ